MVLKTCAVVVGVNGNFVSSILYPSLVSIPHSGQPSCAPLVRPNTGPAFRTLEYTTSTTTTEVRCPTGDWGVEWLIVVLVNAGAGRVSPGQSAMQKREHQSFAISTGCYLAQMVHIIDYPVTAAAGVAGSGHCHQKHHHH